MVIILLYNAVKPKTYQCLILWDVTLHWTQVRPIQPICRCIIAFWILMIRILIDDISNKWQLNSLQAELSPVWILELQELFENLFLITTGPRSFKGLSHRRKDARSSLPSSCFHVTRYHILSKNVSLQRLLSAWILHLLTMIPKHDPLRIPFYNVTLSNNTLN